jgi:prepilin-type N-terminal cleavage/methylation domain-containing protein
VKIRTKAFTLVELLVVISIIALLLAILMPALNKVRMQAQLVTCLSNEKQISLAVFMYANDNKDTLPNTKTYFTSLADSGYDGTMIQHMSIWESAAWWTHFTKYFQNNAAVVGTNLNPLLKCRADKSVSNKNYSSYAVRHAVDYYGCFVGPAKTTKFRKPSGTVYLLEYQDYHDTPMLGYWPQASILPAKQRKINVMFIDGQVATIKWTSYDTTWFTKPPPGSADITNGWDF